MVTYRHSLPRTQCDNRQEWWNYSVDSHNNKDKQAEETTNRNSRGLGQKRTYIHSPRPTNRIFWVVTQRTIRCALSRIHVLVVFKCPLQTLFSLEGFLFCARIKLLPICVGQIKLNCNQFYTGQGYEYAPRPVPFTIWLSNREIIAGGGLVMIIAVLITR